MNAVLGVLVAVAAVTPSASSSSQEDVFPYQQVTVVAAADAPGGPAPEGTLWVTVDDGTAHPTQSVSRAVPIDGTPSTDAAYDDPARCDHSVTGPDVCWRYWQQVGSEVRVWITFHGQSCVLVGSLDHQHTTVNCDGDPVATA